MRPEEHPLAQGMPGPPRPAVDVDRETALAFRFARSGLADRGSGDLAEAAPVPASDGSRDAALLALAARAEDVSRARYEQAIDAGELVLAHAVRGAIHAMAPADQPRFGRALVARDDDELGAQLGQQVQRLAAEHGFTPGEALAEVGAATREALTAGEPLDKNALHRALRERVRPELMPWCTTCESRHVAPMLWRYATVAVGARLDARRRYVLDDDGQGAGAEPPTGSEAVRRFLRAYGPAKPGDFAEWAGLARPHARRLWDELAGELADVRVDGRAAQLLRDDLDALASPPAATGVRLLPPADPYLQRPNRALLVPDAALRKRLFRPVASPGAVTVDGRLAGLWRMRLEGATAKLDVEPLETLPRAALDEEAERVARLRGAGSVAARRA